MRSVAVGGTILWVGCGGSRDPVPETDTEGDPVQVFCGAVCAAYDRCAPAFYLSACLSSCTGDPGNLGLFRPDLMEVEATCMEEELCSRVINDDYWTDTCIRRDREAVIGWVPLPSIERSVSRYPCAASETAWGSS